MVVATLATVTQAIGDDDEDQYGAYDASGSSGTASIR